MIEQIFKTQFIDLSKVVCMKKEQLMQDDLSDVEGTEHPYSDTIVFYIQLLEKPIKIINPKSGNDWKSYKRTNKEISDSTEKEFERILLLWKKINKPVETTNEQPYKYFELTRSELTKDKRPPLSILHNKDMLILQYSGWSINLKSDGTWEFEETFGG